MNLTIEQEEMVEFIEILKVAERDGYKTYIHKENNYGYILNDDYVLYIRKNYFGRWIYHLYINHLETMILCAFVTVIY